MSSELFIHKFILPLAVWGIICLPLVGLLLEAVARMRRPQRTTPVVVKSRHQDDLVTTLDALDRVIRTLEAYELGEWRAQYRVVEDAELIAEQYQARLEMREEG